MSGELVEILFQELALIEPGIRRRTRILPGTESPLRNCKTGQLDWVIVRENSEGEYAGHGGRSHTGYNHEVATGMYLYDSHGFASPDLLTSIEISIFTRVGVERIARFAFQLAQSRPRRKLTYVTKSNAQRNGMVMWDEVVNEVAKEFPDVELDHMLGKQASSHSGPNKQPY